MCCIFTCCGWVMDLFQRFWTFAMSCFISSAVCCAFITAAMSGVALGYNYSLAEYIENKETNVSVYLKRGVFDDEVINELDWRRGGGGPPPLMEQPLSLERSGEESNLGTTFPSSVPDFPFAQRRVGDAGIFTTTTVDPPNNLYSFESDDHHRFEGSLLKFTGKTFNYVSTPFTVTEDLEMAQLRENYPKDSVEQIKAMQGLLNRRKMQYDFLTTKSDEKPVPEVKLVTFDVTTDDNAPIDEASQMKIIQKLLNERKMSALKHPPSRTVRPSSWPPVPTHTDANMIPYFGGRRMGGDSPPIQSQMDSILQSDEFRNPPLKWYDRIPTEQSTVPAFVFTRPTSARGPVTAKIIVSTTPPPRAPVLNVEKMTEDELSKGSRRKNADSEYDSDKFTENEIEDIMNEAKDYDYENVKGIPVRKKRGRRGRRGRRDIKDSSTETKPSENNNENIDSIKKESEKSLFSNASSILKTIQSIFTSDQVKSDIPSEVNFSKSTFIGSSIPSTNVINRTFANIESTTETVILKTIKSTIVTS